MKHHWAIWFVIGYAIGVQVAVFIGAISQGWRP